MKRILLYLLSTQASLLIVASSFAQTSPGWQASPEVVKRLSASGAEFNYYEEKVPAYVLPDLLLSSSGKKVTTAQQWNEGRRREVLDLFREHVYGRVPGTHYNQEFRVTREDRQAIGGAATLKQVDILINSSGNNLTVKLTLFTPNKTGKAWRRLLKGDTVWLFSAMPTLILIILMNLRMAFMPCSIPCREVITPGGRWLHGRGEPAAAWIIL
ncbi:MAG: hypothetical protein MUE32_02285 [Bacteroidales bacterium]|nr:hypothetical protein [Bacteroidales bacterium]